MRLQLSLVARNDWTLEIRCALFTSLRIKEPQFYANRKWIYTVSRQAYHIIVLQWGIHLFCNIYVEGLHVTMAGYCHRVPPLARWAAMSIFTSLVSVTFPCTYITISSTPTPLAPLLPLVEKSFKIHIVLTFQLSTRDVRRWQLLSHYYLHLSIVPSPHWSLIYVTVIVTTQLLVN